MSDTQVQAPPEAPFEAEGDIPGKLGLAGLLLGTLALGVYGGWPILVVVLSLVIMIFMHELGHYLTAKSAGMKVTEFFLGFGPRIWSFQRGETEYGIKAIPAGAYVKIIGMNNLEEVDPSDESRTYRQKSYPRRMSVAVAGSTMHFLMALVLAFVALVGYGVYDDHSAEQWTVSELSTPAEVQDLYGTDNISDDAEALLASGETPAQAAGLEPGDRVLSVDGQTIETYEDFRTFVQEHPGDEVSLVVERGDSTFDTTLAIGERTDVDGEVQGFVGLAHDEPLHSLGVIEAAQRSVTSVGSLMVDSVKAIGQFFTPSGLSNFADTVFNAQEPDEQPTRATGTANADSSSSEDGRIMSIVGAARLGAQATDADGLYALLQIMVVLNVFIGLFNLIPLLPFDGGHVAIGTYERIREIGRKGRYQADLTKMLPVAYAVVLFMVTIGAMALYADIADPINFPG